MSPESPDGATSRTDGSSRRRFLAATAAAATAGLAGCAAPLVRIDRTERTTEHRFDATDLDGLRVADATDDVQIESTDGDAVVVGVHKRAVGGTAPSDLEFRSRVEDGTLRLTTRKPDVVGIGGGSVGLEIAVPDGVAVEHVGTVDGSVAAVDLPGDVDIETGDGEISVERVDGAVTARTDDGSVTVRDTGPVGDVHTDDGSVAATVPAVDGSATISSDDGEVVVTLGADLDATVEATTGDGDIVVAGGLDEVRRDGEHRVVGTAGDGTNELTIHTGDGDVRLESV